MSPRELAHQLRATRLEREHVWKLAEFKSPNDGHSKTCFDAQHAGHGNNEGTIAEFINQNAHAYLHLGYQRHWLWAMKAAPAGQ